MTFSPNAVLRIAFTISAPGLDYGKMTFLKFARKCQSSVTGNSAPFFRTPLNKKRMIRNKSQIIRFLNLIHVFFQSLTLSFEVFSLFFLGNGNLHVDSKDCLHYS